MAITEEHLAQKIKQALDIQSNNPDINPEVARREMAEDLAAAFAEFVIGREAIGTGYSGVQVISTIQG